MPSLNQISTHALVQLIATVGTLVIGYVVIIYCRNFVGRLTTPRRIRAQLRVGMVAACVVIVLAMLDVYLTATLS